MKIPACTILMATPVPAPFTTLGVVVVDQGKLGEPYRLAIILLVTLADVMYELRCSAFRVVQVKVLERIPVQAHKVDAELVFLSLHPAHSLVYPCTEGENLAAANTVEHFCDAGGLRRPALSMNLSIQEPFSFARPDVAGEPSLRPGSSAALCTSLGQAAIACRTQWPCS